MKARILIAAPLALMAGTAQAGDDVVSFTGGEHEGYSRVVVSEGAASVSADEQARTVDLAFGKGAKTFDLREVTEARKAHRVASVKKIDSPSGAVIRLQLNCDCAVDTVRRKDGATVLNISDRGAAVTARPAKAKSEPAETTAEDDVSLEEARARMIELLQRAANDGLITIRSNEAADPAPAAAAAPVTLAETVPPAAANPAPEQKPFRPCQPDSAFAIDGARFEKEPLVEISLLQAELANAPRDRSTVIALAQGFLAINFADEALALLMERGEGETLLAEMAAIAADKAPSPDGAIHGAKACTGAHALWQAAGSAPEVAADTAKMSGEAVLNLPKRLRAAVATRIAAKMVAAEAWSGAQHFYRIASEASEAPSDDLKFVAAELLEHDGGRAESQKMLLELSTGDAEASKQALLALARRYAEGEAPHEGYVEDIGALALTDRGTAIGSEAAFREAMLWADSGNVEASVLLLRNATGSSLGASGAASRQARDVLAAAFQSADDGKRASALSAYLGNTEFIAPDISLTQKAATTALDLGLPNAALAILRGAKAPADKPTALLTAKAAIAAGEGDAALAAAAPFASDPAFAALVVDAHLALNRGSAALAAASAFTGPERAAQTARAAMSTGDWTSVVRAYREIDPNDLREETAVEFALAAYMSGERALPPAAEAALAKFQSKSLAGLKALFAAPANGPLVQRLKALVQDADTEIKLIEEMREHG